MNENNERHISIGELFLHAFRQWKLLILGAVLGALLLGAFSYYKSVKNYNKAVEAQKNDAEAAQELTDSEKEYVDTIAEQYDDAIKAQKDYAETYLAKMDAKNVYEKDIDLYVKLTDTYAPEEKAIVLNDLMEAYRIFLNSYEFRNGVTDVVTTIGINEVEYLVGASYTNRILNIKIKANTQKDVNAIHEYINERITEYTQTIVTTIAGHTIEVYSVKEYKAKDTGISDAQKAYRDSLNAPIETIKGTFANMKYEQILLLEEKLGEKLTEIFNTGYDKLGINVPKNVNTSSTTELPIKGINKKQIVIGLFLGIIVVFGGACCSVLFSKKIKVSDDARLSADYEVYGPVATKDGIGKITRKIYGISQNTVDEQMEYAAKRISMDSKNAGINEITVISSCIDGETVKEYMSKMNIEGVKAEIIDGSLKNTDALKKLDEAGNIVFMEKYNTTIRNDYEYEVSLAKKNGKNVLGTLMLV